MSLLCLMSLYDPLFTRNTPISEKNSLMTPFFTLLVLSPASDKHYFSKYWGDGCMDRPPPQTLGEPSPSPSMSPPMVASRLLAKQAIARGVDSHAWTPSKFFVAEVAVSSALH